MNILTGKAGESLAEKFLRAEGYEILASNYMVRGGEIDIVAKDKTEIVFVEVKSRTSVSFGEPVEAVTKRKVHKLLNAAQIYMMKNKIESDSFRIDVISIQLDKAGKVHEIEHIKNILND